MIIWEMATGKEVVRLKHDSPADSVAWSPDGTRIASSNWHQIVKIWEVGTWREIQSSIVIQTSAGIIGRR